MYVFKKQKINPDHAVFLPSFEPALGRWVLCSMSYASSATEACTPHKNNQAPYYIAVRSKRYDQTNTSGLIIAL